MPACSPACTRLQNSASKWSGYLRNAAASADPVSTSVLISISSFATAGFDAPFDTMSKDCSSGTPAFIMVASWRVKSVMSLSVTLPPPRSEERRVGRECRAGRGGEQRDEEGGGGLCG